MISQSSQDQVKKKKRVGKVHRGQNVSNWGHARILP